MQGQFMAKKNSIFATSMQLQERILTFRKEDNLSNSWCTRTPFMKNYSRMGGCLVKPLLKNISGRKHHMQVKQVPTEKELEKSNSSSLKGQFTVQMESKSKKRPMVSKSTLNPSLLWLNKQQVTLLNLLSVILKNIWHASLRFWSRMWALGSCDKILKISSKKKVRCISWRMEKWTKLQQDKTSLSMTSQSVEICTPRTNQLTPRLRDFFKIILQQSLANPMNIWG